MTELQMGLIGLGIIAVVGVVAYNRWQESRQRRAAEEALKLSVPDVLLEGAREAAAQDVARGKAPDAAPAEAFALSIETPGEDERREPVLRTEPETDAPDAPAAGRGGEEPAQAPVKAEPAAPPPASLPEDLRYLSPRVDFIASIDSLEPVPARRILDAAAEALAGLRRPARWVGYDEAAGVWQLVAAGQTGEYRHIRAGLQLVDRRGLVGEADLAVFSKAVQDLADQWAGIAEVPPWPAALVRAAELDELCASLDIQIGVNVVSQGAAFQGTKLRALAESAGMAIDDSRRYALRDEDGNALFVLLNQEDAGFTAETMRTMSTQGLTFLLDVPNVAHGERVFGQMIALARRFAEVLHGALVDDNRRPLSDAALDPIRRQIEQYQKMLADQHLPAGGPLAQRLFS
ncbi:MAG: cell division protein ZipA C-terminal FtsZ-binding domain-containing protein [Candidatus Accumulibacter sp.]|jgi:FtsZ-interacting cell division protein ZipA|nr:cell division protein ZipA C-terminal FtsZ-binding domain-containing protein [Accumulibacter sp.]